MVLTGRTDRTAATAKSAEQQVSARPRQALPKGEARPGNVKVDYRPAPQQPQQGPDQTPQTPRQAKIAQLRQSVADRQAVAQQQAAAQQQVAAQQAAAQQQAMAQQQAAQQAVAQQQAAQQPSPEEIARQQAAQKERERISKLPRRHQQTALKNSQARNSTTDQISQHMS